MTNVVKKSVLRAFGIEVEAFPAIVEAYITELTAWNEQEARVAAHDKPVVKRPIWKEFAKSKEPIADFRKAQCEYEQDRLTRPKSYPAPVAPQFVMDSVRKDGAKLVSDFRIDDDDPTADQILRSKKNILLNEIANAESAALETVAPPGKRRLFQMQHKAVMAKLTDAQLTLQKDAWDAINAGQARFEELSSRQRSATEEAEFATIKASRDGLAQQLKTVKTEADKCLHDEDRKVLAEADKRNQAIADIEAKAAQAMSDIEDLTPENVDQFEIPVF
jgi:hypothetical protein